MTDVKISRLPARIEGAKRQYAPYEIKWTCPQCKRECVQDCTIHYFSYPAFGKPETLHLYCQECENDDVVITVKIDLTVEVVG